MLTSLKDFEKHFPRGKLYQFIGFETTKTFARAYLWIKDENWQHPVLNKTIKPKIGEIHMLAKLYETSCLDEKGNEVEEKVVLAEFISPNGIIVIDSFHELYFEYPKRWKRV